MSGIVYHVKAKRKPVPTRLTALFSEIGKSNVMIAGGKGASLGEMTQAGIPVPPGCIVLAGAFDRFLEEEDLIQEIDAHLRKVNYKDTNSVDRASNEIRDLIHDAPMPADIRAEVTDRFAKMRCPLVAVRSSATAEDSSVASWAGELESYLNTTRTTLLANLKNCWSSLYTPRAIFYRHENKLLKKRVSVAVVVQKMIQSEVSGITFTVHPVTKDPNQMIIEAGFGLGEAIVSGQITPDSYVIAKRERMIMDINVAAQTLQIVRATNGNRTMKLPPRIGGKQKLSGKQIMEIADICLGVEKHYGFPCDIEWAFAKGAFYVVQSRPITTL